MKGLLIGLAVGAAVAGGAVKLWANSQMDAMVKDYMADEQELNHLKGENGTLRITLNSLESNAYQRDLIKICILKDGLRMSAMNIYLAGQPMNEFERGAFRDFSALLPSIAGKSAQAKLVALTLENAKLTDECLDGAKIPVPAFVRNG